MANSYGSHGYSGQQTNRKPDYKVWAAQGERQGTVGVAWKNDDGTINVKFYDFISISNLGQEKLTIKLYPKDDRLQQDDLPF